MKHIFRPGMGAFVFASTLLLTCGCASNKNEVRCDGHLAPINRPASAKSAAATPSSPSLASPVRTSAPAGETEGK
jgi:hypothetical protein